MKLRYIKTKPSNVQASSKACIELFTDCNNIIQELKYIKNPICHCYGLKSMLALVITYVTTIATFTHRQAVFEQFLTNLFETCQLLNKNETMHVGCSQ